MKHITLRITVAASVLALSGCMATGGDSDESLLSNDWNSMSCEEINAAITSYSDTNSTVSSLTSLASSVGVNTSAVNSAQGQANNVLYRAKNAARPIAQQKGCQVAW